MKGMLLVIGSATLPMADGAMSPNFLAFQRPRPQFELCPLVLLGILGLDFFNVGHGAHGPGSRFVVFAVSPPQHTSPESVDATPRFFPREDLSLGRRVRMAGWRSPPLYDCRIGELLPFYWDLSPCEARTFSCNPRYFFGPPRVTAFSSPVPFNMLESCCARVPPDTFLPFSSTVVLSRFWQPPPAQSTMDPVFLSFIHFASGPAL